MRTDKKSSHKADKKSTSRGHKQGVVGYSKKSALLEEAITHMNTGKYGRSSAALKELLSLDPQNTEARRLFATLHLRLGSLVTAREAFESLANEAIGRQDYWLAESLLREYLAAGPRCIPFLELLANVYHDKGDDMAAVTELGKAIEILLEDPDPDNPRKPAQLYSRIRELAPGSPAAFQFASSFDIQTGEFRIVTPPVSSQAPGADVSREQPASQPVSYIQPDSQPEVMPWEQVDELPVSPLSPSSLLPVVEVPEPLPSGFVTNPTERAAPPFALEPTTSGETIPGIVEIPAEPAILSVDSGPVAVAPVLDEAPPRESQTMPCANPEVEDRGAIVSEPQAEIPERASVDSTGTADSVSIPSRMPWEHVADPALQILETEAGPSAPKPEAASISLNEPAVASGQSTSMDLEPLAAAQPLEDTPFKPTSSQSAIVPEAAQDPQQVESPSPTPSAPKSFSWNAIFDTAWKIAAGTTAPSFSTPVTEPDTSAISDTKDIQQQNQGEASSVPENTKEFSYHLSTEPAGEPHNEAGTSSIPIMESVSPMTPLAGLDRASEGMINDIQTATATSDFSPAPAEPIAEPSPAAPTPTADDLLRAVSEPSGGTLASQPEASDPVVAPATFSFSAVVDSAPIPSATTSEFNVVPSPSQAPAVEEPLSEPAPLSAMQPAMSSATAINVPEPPAAPSVTVPWNTGEVAVQSHRPSAKKKRWEKDHSRIAEQPTDRPVDFRPAPDPIPDEVHEESTSLGETIEPAIEEVVAQKVDTRPEWAQASDTIMLTRPEPVATTTWEANTSGSFQRSQGPTTSAASAIDVLFGSTARDTQSVPKDHAAVPRTRRRMAARLARVRQNVSLFVGSCFSTTRAFVFLCVSLAVLSVVTIAMGIGVVALAWIVMEEPPTSRYQSLTVAPQRMITDYAKNGYFLLLGFDAPDGQDPNQVGYERKVDEQDRAMAASCMQGSAVSGATVKGGAPANLVDGWFKSPDPLAQLKGQSETVKSLVLRHGTVLSRYQKWLTMPFDDWGYGKVLSPNCPQILLAHRLYVLEGFSQDTAAGLNRLEKDMETWRATLGQSKTLMTKMLAVTAVQDDARLASSLLVLPDTDGAVVARLSKLVRPFDQLELSVRWPMQSHFVWATGSVSADLKRDRTEDRPLHVALAVAMPLPVQRRANAYAEYYDAANKAVAEGRYSSLPKVSTFLRTSGASPVDYWANPIELLVGIEPLPTWDTYVGRMVEADAQLRLASLQAWVRRGPQDGDVLTRLAKAGQAYHDPFTGLPMLVNQQRRLLYSVGRDGKDQDGDQTLDVVAAIPNLASSVGKQPGGK